MIRSTITRSLLIMAFIVTSGGVALPALCGGDSEASTQPAAVPDDIEVSARAFKVDEQWFVELTLFNKGRSVLRVPRVPFSIYTRLIKPSDRRGSDDDSRNDNSTRVFIRGGVVELKPDEGYIQRLLIDTDKLIAGKYRVQVRMLKDDTHLDPEPLTIDVVVK